MNRLPYRLLLTALLLCLMPGFLLAQARFEARTDSRQVLQGSYFDVSFTLFDGNGSNFRPPSFSDFIVVSGPNRSLSTTMINGQVTREASYNYTLQPRALGTFTITPATIQVGKQQLSTEPLSIEVVEGRDGELSDNEKVFIKAELSTDEAYIGQQITLQYKIYTTVDLKGYNILEEAEYRGFYAVDMRRYDGRRSREIVDGVSYTTKVLKQVALYPQQTGTLTIDPLQAQLSVLKEGSSRSRSFFFNQEVRRIPASTEALTVSVKPLPDNAPADFSGAVGQYEMEVKLTPTKATTDDAISMLMILEGNGDVMRIQPPELGLPSSIEVYDPQVVSEDNFELGPEIVGRKVFEYLLLPKEPGQFEFAPSFSYFSPDSTKYVTLSSKTYQLDIRPGDGSTSASVRTQVEEPDALAPLKTGLELYEEQPPFFGSALFWGLAALPFLLFGAALGFRQIRRQRANTDPAAKRLREAQQQARQRLSNARGHLQRGDSRAFYDEISKATLGYIGDKLRIPRSAMSQEGLRTRLQELQLPEELIKRVIDIVRESEMALFAGKAGGKEEMQRTLERTEAAITQIEQRPATP